MKTKTRHAVACVPMTSNIIMKYQTDRAFIVISVVGTQNNVVDILYYLPLAPAQEQKYPQVWTVVCPRLHCKHCLHRYLAYLARTSPGQEYKIPSRAEGTKIILQPYYNTQNIDQAIDRFIAKPSLMEHGV